MHEHAESMSTAAYTPRHDRQVGLWLAACAAVIFGMILLGGVTRLTESGLAEALRIVRRHRVLETYLQLKLGFAWDDVHDEAERLEHAASDALIERMAAALGEPSHAPHGAPIPTATGEIEAPIIATLAWRSQLTISSSSRSFGSWRSNRTGLAHRMRTRPPPTPSA